MCRLLEILLRYITVHHSPWGAFNSQCSPVRGDQARWLSIPAGCSPVPRSPWNDASVAYFETSFTRRLYRHYNLTHWRVNKTRYCNATARFNKRNKENQRILFPPNFSIKFFYYFFLLSFYIFKFLHFCIYFIAERKMIYIFTQLIN